MSTPPLNTDNIIVAVEKKTTDPLGTEKLIVQDVMAALTDRIFRLTIDGIRVPMGGGGGGGVQ